MKNSSHSDPQRSWLTALQTTLTYLELLARHCSEAQLIRPAASGGWSASETLAHLRACQEIWQRTIYAAAQADVPALPDQHPRQWCAIQGYNQVGYAINLAAFQSDRDRLLGFLAAVAERCWNQGVLIGRRRHTMGGEVRRMALHEQAHWAQLVDFLPPELQPAR